MFALEEAPAPNTGVSGLSRLAPPGSSAACFRPRKHPLSCRRGETLIDIGRVCCKSWAVHISNLCNHGRFPPGSPPNCERISEFGTLPSSINLPAGCSMVLRHTSPAHYPGSCFFYSTIFCSHHVVRGTVSGKSDTHSLPSPRIDRYGKFTCQSSHDTGICRVGSNDGVPSTSPA